MRKFIFKLFIWVLVIVFFVCSAILALGYFKYKQALNSINLQDAILEIKSNSNYITLNNVSNDYKSAVVCIEDHRFYNHNGIDLISIIRSSYVNFKRKSLDYGASTITQQVGRNIYFTQEKSPVRKIAEIFIALDLEKNYTKDEILELYINIIYFGNGYYGIYDASKGYFNKEPSELNFYESTYLAGLPNAPSIYSTNEKLGEERRLQVVESMNRH